MSDWNVNDLRKRGTQPWRPQSGIEGQTGKPYPLQPGLADALNVPLDPGINLQGWINPYSLTQYQITLNTSQAVQAAPSNLRRAYLVLQNQGPGNVFVAFGATAIAPTALQNSNCLQLITTQFYEQIGGGSMDPMNGMPRPGLFVTPDYISAITDTANTTLLIMEGVFMMSRWASVIKSGAQF